jgi:tetratricopeptide (TPR) repeat protein
VEQARPFPEQLELVRSLRPFKRHWLSGRRLRLDIDATAVAYARTWQLIPALTPAPERWFEVALVVDDSPSMAVWGEEVAGLSRVLRQAGVFRNVRSFRLSVVGTDGPDAPSPILVGEGDRPYAADRLRGPDSRRLIIIVTDGAAPGWRHPAAWATVRTWAASTPTVLVSPLATRLWRQTGLDLPAVRTSALVPGSPNAMLKYSVPLYLREPEEPARAWLPVPAVTISPHRLARWARMLMRGDPSGCEALLIPLAGRPADYGVDSDQPSDLESVRTFLRLAAPEAARLAVLCSLFATVTLPLLRFIRQELVPSASTGDLAEVIVSGLFLPPDPAADGDLLRFRDDARAALQEILAESDAWHIYDALQRHIDSQQGAARTFPAAIPAPSGGVVLPAELVPTFTDAAADVLDFLDVPLDTTPVIEGEPLQPGPVAPLSAGAAVLTAAPTLGSGIVVGNIPTQPPAFQARTELLQSLDQSKPGVWAIIGMPGTGKTQVAAAYARGKVAASWRLVAWMHAENEGRLLTGLAEVADALGLQDAATVEEAGLAVRHWLETDGDRCLIVLDDASDVAYVRPYLPTAGRARVLITTRSPSVAVIGSQVDLGVLTVSEAVDFLVERTGQTDTKGAAALAAELGYLPLALALAGALIAEQSLPYQHYLSRLRARLVEPYLSPTTREPYLHTFADAVLLSLVQVQDGALGYVCTLLIEIVALLSASGVPRDLLHAAGEGVTPPVSGHEEEVSADGVDEALGRLADLSLLSFSMDGRTVFGHPLTMRVIREDLVRRGRLANAVRPAASVLVAQAQSLTAMRNRPAVRTMIEQIAALTEQVAALLPDKSSDSELPRVLLKPRSWAIYYLNELGDSASQVIVFGESLASDLERMLGTDHAETLAALSNLAIAYGAVGDLDRAIGLHERTLIGRDRVLGKSHPDTLLSRGNLAVAYQEAGRLAEAVSLHEETLIGLERVFGPEDPRTLAARNNLAITLRDLGRPADALPLFERTLRAREQVLGPDHPATLASANNLAITLQNLGQPADTLPLLERTAHASERVFGPDNPNTLIVQNNLGNALLAAGQPAGAIAWYERSLATSERTLGSDHPYARITRDNLVRARKEAARAPGPAAEQARQTE